MSQITHPVVKPLKTTPNLWLPVLLVMTTGGLLVIIVFLTLAYQLIYLNRIYPGVSVAGINVGGLSEADVMTILSNRTPEYLSRRVTLQYGLESWTFTGQELGMRLDVAATANAAYTIGRKGD